MALRRNHGKRLEKNGYANANTIDAVYFLHPQPRKSHRRGTFCGHDHAKSAAAETSMQSSRTQGQEQLIEAAARKLLVRRISGPQWHHDQNKSGAWPRISAL